MYHISRMFKLKVPTTLNLTLVKIAVLFTGVILLCIYVDPFSVNEWFLSDHYTGEIIKNVSVEFPSEPITHSSLMSKWKKISRLQIWVISAYLDSRPAFTGTKNIIRVFGLSFKAEKRHVACCVFDRNKSNPSEITSVISKRNFINPYARNYDGDITYWATEYECAFPKDVDISDGIFVSLHPPKARPKAVEGVRVRRNSYSDKYDGEFVVCISPIFSEISPSTLVEMMERNLHFGADFISIYDYKLSSDIKKVVKMYKDEGKLDTIPWHLPEKVVNSSHYFGQNLAINDCLYRYMGRYKYIIITDLDEVITPLKHPSWGAMMGHLSHLDTASNYVFLNQAFSYKDNSKSNISTVASRVFAKQVTPHPAGVRSKMVLDPSRVMSVGVHEVFKSIKGFKKYVVSPYVGILSHFKVAGTEYEDEKYEPVTSWEMIPDLEERFQWRLKKLQLL